MRRIPDQTRAALLVLAVVLTAGMFAGFSFGATASEVARPTAPLLLQSTSIVRSPQSDCERSRTVRQAHAESADRARRGV